MEIKYVQVINISLILTTVEAKIIKEVMSCVDREIIDRIADRCGYTEVQQITKTIKKAYDILP